MSGQFLLYGSTGYSGGFIAKRAVARGLRPVLAGRHAAKVAAQAETLGLPHRACDLGDAAAMDAALHDVCAVLHCAGPFGSTALPMVEACLRTKTHYLDINGELAVFEAIGARHAEACARGVMLLPGVGQDVVPTDCLAARVFARLPSATVLRLGIQPMGRLTVSRGSARTMRAMQLRWLPPDFHLLTTRAMLLEIGHAMSGLRYRPPAVRWRSRPSRPPG